MRSILIAVKTGGAEILAHKTRSVLSFLAIAVGSVVFIDAFSAICDTYQRLQEQKAVSGMARMTIIQNQSQTWSSPDDYVSPPDITYADVQELKKKIPGLYMVSPTKEDWREILEYQDHRIVTTVHGVTPDWMKRDFVYTIKGRFMDWHDVEHKLRVCVLVKKSVPPPTNSWYKGSMKAWDYTRAFDVFVSHNDLLGKVIKLDGINFTVIGVLEELSYSRKPKILVGDSESGRYKVLAPVTTLVDANFINDSMTVNIDTGDEATFEDTMRQVKNFLKIRYGDENYFVVTNQLDVIREAIASSVKASLMTISLGMLAFIAGGIGIMNVTLATVFARTKEIGIRRAIGASHSDIMLQFIVEAVMLGVIGGVLGSAIGYLWGVPGKVIIGLDPSPIKIWMPVVAVFIAAFTSFLFAIYPAWVAASLKPADALRAE